MKKPLIGLPFWKTGDNSFGSTISYIQFAERYGEVVPLMPRHTVRQDLDLLILPGGADVDPLRYDEVPDYYTGKSDVFKEHFDKVYLQQYIDAGIPIFAICRGMQSVGVHFGAKLVQHMNHETNDITKDPYIAKHSMKITPQFSTALNFTRNKLIHVNSRHHQVISPIGLPPSIKILGVHTPFIKEGVLLEGDGSIEMIAHDSLPIIGLQSHPEDSIDENCITFVDNIIEYLIRYKKSILK